MMLPGLFILIDNSLLSANQREKYKIFMKFLIYSDSYGYENDSLASGIIKNNRDCDNIPLTINESCYCLKLEKL